MTRRRNDLFTLVLQISKFNRVRIVMLRGIRKNEDTSPFGFLRCDCWVMSLMSLCCRYDLLSGKLFCDQCSLWWLGVFSMAKGGDRGSYRCLMLLVTEVRPVCGFLVIDGAAITNQNLEIGTWVLLVIVELNVLTLWLLMMWNLRVDFNRLSLLWDDCRFSKLCFLLCDDCRFSKLCVYLFSSFLEHWCVTHVPVWINALHCNGLIPDLSMELLFILDDPNRLLVLALVLDRWVNAYRLVLQSFIHKNAFRIVHGRLSIRQNDRRNRSVDPWLLGSCRTHI